MRPLAVLSLLAAASALAGPPAPSKELTEKGKSLFAINCAACHGPKGAGDGPAAVALNPKPRSFTTDPFKNGDRLDEVFKTFTVGMKDTSMVAFGHIPEPDRWALAYFVLELRGNAARPDAGAAIKPGKKK